MPSSWAEMIEYYQQIKDQPVNKKWVYLDGWVRGYLTNDLNRLVKLYNYEIEPEDFETMKAFQATLEACVADTTCLDPVLTSELRSFAERKSTYAPYLNLIRSNSLPADKRAYVQKLVGRLGFDLMTFEFYRNGTVVQVAPGKFEVPMSLGPYADAGSELSSYFDREWIGDTHSLRVVWEDPSKYPNIFRLFKQEGMGRAFVRQGAREMHLADGTLTRAVAHEFGHVVGFPDEYFTIWNSSNCTYTYRTNSESIMGDSEDGIVLPRHWAELEKQYPLK
ncbi:hypothetical protein EON80_29400 [bacterium]|nr:MAG: hypothetical protein EON80_29400 [bacterium]